MHLNQRQGRERVFAQPGSLSSRFVAASAVLPNVVFFLSVFDHNQPRTRTHPHTSSMQLCNSAGSVVRKNTVEKHCVFPTWNERMRHEKRTAQMRIKNSTRPPPADPGSGSDREWFSPHRGGTPRGQASFQPRIGCHITQKPVLIFWAFKLPGCAEGLPPVQRPDQIWQTPDDLTHLTVLAAQDGAAANVLTRTCSHQVLLLSQHVPACQRHNWSTAHRPPARHAAGAAQLPQQLLREVPVPPPGAAAVGRRGDSSADVRRDQAAM